MPSRDGFRFMSSASCALRLIMLNLLVAQIKKQGTPEARSCQCPGHSAGSGADLNISLACADRFRARQIKLIRTVGLGDSYGRALLACC